MNIDKQVKNALKMLSMADEGIVLLDINNEVIHPADAAFRGETVQPYDAVKFIEESFLQSGINLKDRGQRLLLIELLVKLEMIEGDQRRKKTLDKIFRKAEFEDFGKII